MKTIGIFTTSRAEFGLLSNLVDAVIADGGLEYILFVGGGHHMTNQGRSINEIVDKGYKTVGFNFFLDSDTDRDLTQSMGIELFQLSELFSSYNFDCALVLGDRIELLPIVQTAIIFRKPVVHIHGGEVTEGALDDQIRHMITKAAHIHFCATEEYRQNVIKMGEEEWRVNNVGALSIDSINSRANIPKQELFTRYSLDPSKPTVLLTYHPVTLEFENSIKTQLENLFEALNKFQFQILITAPNIDSGHHYLFNKIQSEVLNNDSYSFVRSMGIANYQSMLNYVEFVIGNSSSGIAEVPFFKIPTVNIGDRQKGRIRHKSVIDTDYSVQSICAGIEKAMSPEFRESLGNMKYEFGDGHAAEQIVDILKKTKIDQKLIRKKLEFPCA